MQDLRQGRNTSTSPTQPFASFPGLPDKLAESPQLALQHLRGRLGRNPRISAIGSRHSAFLTQAHWAPKPIPPTFRAAKKRKLDRFL